MLTHEPASPPEPAERREGGIFSTIDDNFEYLDNELGKDIGLVKGKYTVLGGHLQIGLVYLYNMADGKSVSRFVIEPLLAVQDDLGTIPEDIFSTIQSKVVCMPQTIISTDMKEVTESLLYGNTVLFIEGKNSVLVINSRSPEIRPIVKPDLEANILASQDAFNEDLETNCSLIIRRLPISSLRFESFTVGSLSRTKTKMLWIEGIADPSVVTEVRSRIQQINTDFVDNIGVLAELIEDKPFSVFPKYKQTQRPDLVARRLADGHVAILCDNSPFAMFVPIFFWNFFETMDDYSDRSSTVSYLRVIRMLAFLLSLLVSPLYLAFVTYNHAIVPPALALNIASGREGVPFPSAVELLGMTIAIGIIREASLRVPGNMGFFIGVMAAIVIGQSAVTAGYVSASVIIVVSISAISTYAISTTTMIYPSGILNIFLLLLAGGFGMFGLINGIALILWHMVSLESFGKPFMYPLVPIDLYALKATIIRAPFYVLNRRFELLAPNNRIRTDTQNTK